MRTLIAVLLVIIVCEGFLYAVFEDQPSNCDPLFGVVTICGDGK